MDCTVPSGSDNYRASATDYEHRDVPSNRPCIWSSLGIKASQNDCAVPLDFSCTVAISPSNGK